MKKLTKTEVLVELLSDITYRPNKATRHKVNAESIIPDDSNYPNNSDLTPTKVYDELQKLRKKSKADGVGLAEAEDLVKDDRRFVRLAQTWETKILFENFMTIRASHLLAYLLDYIQVDKELKINTITFDKDILWKKYFFNCDSTYNNAINDLICGGLISRPNDKRQSMIYYINPNILSCGNVVPQSDKDDVNKTVRVLNNKELDRKNIDKRILDVFSCQPSTKKNVNTKICAYVENGNNRSSVPFFKLYRSKFSKSLLTIKKKSSFKVLSYIIGQFLPEDDDNARLDKEEVLPELNIKKTNYYSTVADILNAGLVYRDAESNQYKFNPNVWFSGSVIKLYDKRLRTHQEKSKDKYLATRKRRLVDALTEIVS